MATLHRTLALLPLFFLLYLLPAQESLNMELLGQFNKGDGRASGCWSYVDGQGNEYGILGAQTGTAVVRINADNTLEEIAFIPGPPSNWREIMVLGDYAYVTTEGNSSDHPGMQIIDLTGLPLTATLANTFNLTFTRGHILQKDIFEEAPYIYVCGTTATSGVHILDVSDPTQPQEVGLYEPGYYIHDCHVRGHTLYAAAFHEAVTDVLDITDPGNLVLIAQIPDAGGNTHSYTTTLDERYLFVADEQDGLPGRILDITDLEDPKQVALYTANSASLVHNPYMRGDFCFISHNTEGIRVLDMTDPEVPVEVGYYDTFEGSSGGFNGLWSACPYLPSGKILGGNREDGLYVWSFNDTRAGRFYAQVVDSLSGDPLFNATVIVQETQTLLTTDSDGRCQSGGLAGEYTLVVTADGYLNRTFTVTLTEGENEDIILPLPSITSSVTERGNTPLLHLYPNPARDFIFVQLPRNEGLTRLELWNEQGQQLRVQAVPQGTNPAKFNLGGLSSGTYQLIWKDQSGALLDRQTAIRY